MCAPISSLFEELTKSEHEEYALGVQYDREKSEYIGNEIEDAEKERLKVLKEKQELQKQKQEVLKRVWK